MRTNRNECAIQEKSLAEPQAKNLLLKVKVRFL